MGKQLRYLLTTGIYPPDIGGPASYIPQLASLLSKNTDQVEIVTLSEFKTENLLTEFGTVTKVRRKMNKYSRFALVSWKIYKKSKCTEIIFANGLYEECAFARIFCRRKLVFKLVGDPIWERHKNSTESSKGIDSYEFSQLSLKLKFESILFKWSIRQADIITCPGESLAKIIEKNYGVKNITVIPNGVAVTKSKKEVKYKYDIISVSRLVSWKRIDLLVRASARMGVKLLVIGAGPEEESLKRLSLQLEADVDFCGPATKDQVMEYLNQTRIYALVSSYEGLSFSLLEALSCGKRVVVSNIDANQSLFKGTRFAEVVNPDNPLELDSAISQLLDDSQENFIRENAARELVFKQYNSAIQLKKMHELMLSKVDKI
jgi:glycosyltransferase involved in cell wall biosynthesis